MPMSSRKNLSNTIRSLKQIYADQGMTFARVFRPLLRQGDHDNAQGPGLRFHGKSRVSTRVGAGDPGFDVKVGEVCALLSAQSSGPKSSRAWSRC